MNRTIKLAVNRAKLGMRLHWPLRLVFIMNTSLTSGFGRARAASIVGPLCAALVCGAIVAPGAWTPRAVAAPADYVLGVGDTLQISVTNHPDINGEVVVRPDGKITLPGAGEVTALGVTAPRLAREIEKRLARTLNNARVQVTVKAAAPRQASIAGAVKAPGLYTLKPGARVLDLIAGGGRAEHQNHAHQRHRGAARQNFAFRFIRGLRAARQRRQFADQAR